MKRDNYSTLIEDLPENNLNDNLNDNFEFDEDGISLISHTEKNNSISLFYDSIFLFLLTMFITNKQFIKWLSQFNFLQSSKNHLMFSVLLSTINVVIYIIYRFVSDL